jgi:hypothetical protein
MKTAKTISFAIVLSFLFTSFTEHKPRILIIGDSISNGYMPFVEEYFADKAFVKHNPGNAQHSGFGLQKIREWIAGEEWDVIQFNWGLHDLCYRSPESKVQGNRDKVNGKITNTIEQYKTYLDSIVTILEHSTKAKLIFVTTTYVPENEAGRFQDDVQKYNKAALEVMKKHKIQVNDIYSKSIVIHKKWGLGTDNVHYSKEGSAELGKLIVSVLEKQIENNSTLTHSKNLAVFTLNPKGNNQIFPLTPFRERGKSGEKSTLGLICQSRNK